jgi:hypothetical protein
MNGYSSAVQQAIYILPSLQKFWLGFIRKKGLLR